MLIKNKIKIELFLGDIVCLKTDTDKLKRMCTGISIRQNGVSYELTQADKASWHYDFEIDFEDNKRSIGFNK
ncbi:MAG: hypothetical protein IT212_07685 [Bacteroidia bacterium]|nr:hypothetical protein [Bacteroidia bacterium]